MYSSDESDGGLSFSLRGSLNIVGNILLFKKDFLNYSAFNATQSCISLTVNMRGNCRKRLSSIRETELANSISIQGICFVASSNLIAPAQFG